MTTRDDPPDLQAVLKRIAEGSSVSPPWRETIARLTAESTVEERLAAFQAVRDSGWLSEEQGLYLVAATVEEMADAEAEAALRDLDRRLNVLEESLLVEEGSPAPDARNLEEHERLSDEYQQAWDRIFAEKLAAGNEQAIARLYMHNREEFTRQYETGLQELQAVADARGSSDGLVRVASFLDVPSAEMARAALAAEGIPASLGNTTFVSWYWHYSNATGGVTLDVRRGDTLRACNVLDAETFNAAETQPAWTCASCGQRIPGGWDRCWRCSAPRPSAAEETNGNRSGDRPVADTAEASASDAEACATHAAGPIISAVLGVITIGLFVLLPLAMGYVATALFFAPLTLVTVFFMLRFEQPADASDSPPAATEGEFLPDDLLEMQTTVRNATVRRAWQAAVISCIAFPPLAIYALWLLWTVEQRSLPLHPADRRRKAWAYVFSIVAMLLCLPVFVLFAEGEWRFFRRFFSDAL